MNIIKSPVAMNSPAAPCQRATMFHPSATCRCAATAVGPIPLGHKEVHLLRMDEDPPAVAPHSY